MLSKDPTFLGAVESVSGSSLSIRLAPSVSSGFSIIKGKTYKVGQVGSFVKIPQGYQALFGVVSEIGEREAEAELESHAATGRWMKVNLVGETIGGTFERGISQYPNIGDSVHLATEACLDDIYTSDESGVINVGTLSSAESIPATLSLNALVTKHSAVLGSTGSGKSTTIASLVRSIVNPSDGNNSYPNSRVLMLDIHGEYSSALKDIANVFSVQPLAGESLLQLPYWALNTSDLLKLLVGSTSGNMETAFNNKVSELKLNSCRTNQYPGVEEASLTLDTPIPFSLKKVWYDLISEEVKTFSDKEYTQPALIADGILNTLTAPRYTPASPNNSVPYKNKSAIGIVRHLDIMRAKLLDRRYDFLLRPGDWESNENGEITKDLDALLEGWLGGDKPITILDLSSVPSAILELMIGTVLKIVYEAIYWGREKTEGGRERPLLVVMEEAHRYLNSSGTGQALAVTQRIAKEGRKYGIGCMVVSQRPSEVDDTILSQCSTYFALRLTNPTDRNSVKGTLPDGLATLLDVLPVLRTGEAVVMGEAAKLPMRCRVTLPDPEHQPKSRNPDVNKAWSKEPINEDYSGVVAAWRSQRPDFVVDNEDIDNAESN